MANDGKANGGKMEGDRGDHPDTAETKVSSRTQDAAVGQINPSAPGETGTTEKKEQP
jgi:hypothetical protein